MYVFKGEVKKAQVSGNLDAPEGGFDAIMQAIVCKNDIGWRDKARRLLVFSTDAGFHYAGDGKLGGIVKPNDGLCHLDSKGVYEKSNDLDYPSVSQINHKVKESSVNIIFAVTEEQFGVYDLLQQNIEGSSVGTLSADSSNIVELVKAQYQVSYFLDSIMRNPIPWHHRVIQYVTSKKTFWDFRRPVEIRKLSGSRSKA